MEDKKRDKEDKEDQDDKKEDQKEPPDWSSMKSHRPTRRKDLTDDDD
jgi:hypothetical protein